MALKRPFPLTSRSSVGEDVPIPRFPLLIKLVPSPYRKIVLTSEPLYNQIPPDPLLFCLIWILFIAGTVLDQKHIPALVIRSLDYQLTIRSLSSYSNISVDIKFPTFKVS